MNKILLQLAICAVTLVSVPIGVGQNQFWNGKLLIPDTDKAIEFRLEVVKQNEEDRLGRSKPKVFVLNGSERIEIPTVQFRHNYLSFEFPHYDSKISTQITRSEFTIGLGKDDVIRGSYKKRRGDDKFAEMKFVADQAKPIEGDDPEKFLGRWKVKFDSSEDAAVGAFKRVGDSNNVEGTFLTTTGDYRYLSGIVQNENLTVCCFDGAHAFRFEAKGSKSGELQGEFWSSNTWHGKWTAVKDDKAQLADAFGQTTIDQKSGLDELRFPDLNGNKRSVNDLGFQGKARIVYVFGSWCPNCHDAAVYFKELQDKYGPQGLKILGLAFELTSDHRRNAQQVKTYLQKHNVSYPVLITGPADKAEASKAFPVLDKIRSYPTTIFVDEKGDVRAVHTGFTGPATGKSYDELKQKFETLIEEMLAE